MAKAAPVAPLSPVEKLLADSKSASREYALLLHREATCNVSAGDVALLASLTTQLLVPAQTAAVHLAAVKRALSLVQPASTVEARTQSHAIARDAAETARNELAHRRNSFTSMARYMLDEQRNEGRQALNAFAAEQEELAKAAGDAHAALTEAHAAAGEIRSLTESYPGIFEHLDIRLSA